MGAGFTGTVLAVNLLEQLTRPAMIMLFDATGSFGPGLAYGTSHPLHLMNVPADAASAREDRPDDFRGWMAAAEGADEGSAYASRADFGRYLRELLDRAASRSDIALGRVAEEVIGVERGEERFSVRLASGTAIEFDCVALCVGHGIPRADGRTRRIIRQPWAGDWISRVAPDETVVFKGSGLTMVDHVLQLVAAGHRGRLLAVSRHGLLPQRHRLAREPSLPHPGPALAGAGLRRWVSEVRAAVREHQAAGGDWRDVIDALRPATQSLWRTLSEEDRARFLRHLRPYWDTHRHRMAPEVWNEMARLCRDGRFGVEAARIESAVQREGEVALAIRKRGAHLTEELSAGWLIDCTGTDDALRTTPLAWGLLSASLARRENGRIAFSVAPDASLIDGEGTPVPGLYAPGPIGRDSLWEITAIREIRAQCARLAAAIADRAAAIPVQKKSKQFRRMVAPGTPSEHLRRH